MRQKHISSRFSLLGHCFVITGYCLMGALTSSAQVVTVGQNPISSGTGSDAWSSIVLETTPIAAPAGGGSLLGRVTNFTFYADDGRAVNLGNSEHKVRPILASFRDGVYRVEGFGAEVTPTAVGEQTHAFALASGTDVMDLSTPNTTYHIAILQQRDNDEDIQGGVVSFIDGGGAGVILMNVVSDPIPFVPVLDDSINVDHPTFGVSARNYSFNFEIDFTPSSDSDGDMIPDAWEDLYGLDKNDINDGGQDLDGDNLSNLEEFENGSNPGSEDTDGDTLNDDVEVNTLMTSPSSKDTDSDGYDDNVETNTGTWVSENDTGTDPLDADTDDDGIIDGIESNSGLFENILTDTGTSPLLADTDMDGVDDDIEIANGTVATNDQDFPDSLIAGLQDLFGVGERDGWTHLVYIDEARPFFGVAENAPAFALNFSFDTPFTDGVVTPLLLEVTAPDTFVIRAIGTTRVGGTDWTAAGSLSFPFSDTENVEVQDGWVAGFASYDPANPVAGGSAVPFDQSGGADGWLSGSADGTSPPILQVGSAPGEGNSGTFIDGFQNRQYSFNITAGEIPVGFAITDLLFDGGDEITLIWSSAPDTTYGILYSTDLTNFDQDLGVDIPSGEGDSTQLTFDVPVADATKLFFQVVERPDAGQ